MQVVIFGHARSQLFDGSHFQLEKLVQQMEQHQFLMKFSTEPKVSSCATLGHINALLPFLLTFSLNKFSSEVFHINVILRSYTA
ncbi:hypothetical protein CFP56_025813 [Quercus suber]|uniref:Uncharacterized protein n=1 Tax=Quercus suber TaxID=58331 RepID=A0AAW0K3C0_QUESU